MIPAPEIPETARRLSKAASQARAALARALDAEEAALAAGDQRAADAAQAERRRAGKQFDNLVARTEQAILQGRAQLAEVDGVRAVLDGVDTSAAGDLIAEARAIATDAERDRLRRQAAQTAEALRDAIAAAGEIYARQLPNVEQTRRLADLLEASSVARRKGVAPEADAAYRAAKEAYAAATRKRKESQ